MNNLKSCPFCGGVPQLIAPGYEHYSPCWCKCTQCGAEGPTKSSELEAEKGWNERIQGWISVKDRLPEKEGQYLCWFGNNPVFKGAAIATYLEMWKAFGSLESLETYSNVTHWMSIEPPKEDA